MINEFKRQYSLSKTISIGLIPVGRTSETIKTYIEDDFNRGERLGVVKELIDRYHRDFMEKVLSARNIFDDGILHEYEAAIDANDRDNANLCLVYMADMLKKNFYAKKYSIKDKESNLVEIITKLPDKMLFDVMLNSNLFSDEEKDLIKNFDGFSGYFIKFFNTRKTLYDFSVKNGKFVGQSICSRLLNDNLPRHLHNVEVFSKCKDVLALEDTDGYFTIDGFNLMLSQTGIDSFNTVIGGYVKEDGTKIQGFNEKINLHNQQISKALGEKPLPLFRPLYKLPLVLSQSSSFVLSALEAESDVVELIKDISQKFDSTVLEEFESKILTDNRSCDWSEVYFGVNDLPSLSKILTNDWHKIETAWNLRFDMTKTAKARLKENYADKRRLEFKKLKMFSFQDICDLLTSTPEKMLEVLCAFYKSEIKVKILSSVPYAVIERKKGAFSDAEKKSIKTYLDYLKDFERFIKMFCVDEGDDVFVGSLTAFSDIFDGFNGAYNKIKNYCTKKPYSSKKFKLYLNNPDLLGGWSVGIESRRRSFILRDRNTYFLAVSPTSRISALQAESDEEEYYEKMIYMQIPDAAKMIPKVFFSEKFLANHVVEPCLHDIIKRKRAGETLSVDDEQSLIGYYKDCIASYEDWKEYDFRFKDKYVSLRDFLKDVNEQSYVLRFIHISKNTIDKMVESGDLMLFRFFNKNFSEHSHGRDGAYTRYLKLLFEPENKRGQFVQLKGGAELFYRPKSLERRVTHRKNQPINNKIVRNGKTSSTFEYDLIKDRRFTEDRFILNLCLSINSDCGDNYPSVLNQRVREYLANSDQQNIIGINRGERNLIYVTVIDSKGKILESRSLNVIDGVDYNQLLEKRSQKRADERQSWSNISDIKNLKSGYIGKAIHEICNLIVKYDAIVVFDNLSNSFVSSRGKIEKNAYQMFQAAIVQKLNYLCFKDVGDSEIGSFKNGLQLTNPYRNPNDISTQNGILFFLSPWGVSGLDPTTGYVNLLHSKYTNMVSFKGFLGKFSSISFDSSRDMFRFSFDYRSFLNWEEFPEKTCWDLYSNGYRSDFYIEKLNGTRKMQKVDLTAGFKDLMSEFGIALDSRDLKDDILNVETPAFFKRFSELFGLMVQTVNYEDGESYIISPVPGRGGEFFDSRNLISNYPENSDANAAYNMARKGLLLLKTLKEEGVESKSVFSINKVNWLNFATK